jgi:hypothetical protein
MILHFFSFHLVYLFNVATHNYEAMGDDLTPPTTSNRWADVCVCERLSRDLVTLAFCFTSHGLHWVR